MGVTEFKISIPKFGDDITKESQRAKCRCVNLLSVPSGYVHFRATNMVIELHHFGVLAEWVRHGTKRIGRISENGSGESVGRCG